MDNYRSYGYGGYNRRDSERDKISRMSKEGYRQLKANKLSLAKELFHEILAIDGNNNYALVGLGDCERKLCNFEEAVPLYQQCLEIYPDNNYALFGLADCYRSMGRYKEGAEVWEEYLQYDSDNITVLTRVADTYRKLHDYNKSKTFYMRVLDLDPDNSYALIGLGHLNYDYHNYNEALKYWTDMLRLQGDCVDIRVLTSIGNCYRKIKNFAEGYKYFERAIKMEANNFYALFGIADCLRGLGRSDESIKYWQSILKKDNANRPILTRVGDAYRKMGAYDDAADYYNRALDVEYDTYAAMGLALICKEQGNYKEAIERLTRLIENDKENYRPYIELAQCYNARGQKAEAIKTLEAFQRQGIHNEDVTRLLYSLRNPSPPTHSAPYHEMRYPASDAPRYGADGGGQHYGTSDGQHYEAPRYGDDRGGQHYGAGGAPRYGADGQHYGAPPRYGAPHYGTDGQRYGAPPQYAAAGSPRTSIRPSGYSVTLTSPATAYRAGALGNPDNGVPDAPVSGAPYPIGHLAEIPVDGDWSSL